MTDSPRQAPGKAKGKLRASRAITPAPSGKPPLVTLLGLHSRTGLPLLPSSCGTGSSAADRLLQMSSFSRDEYLARFNRMNVYGGRTWDERKARRSGRRMLPRLGGVAVVLGRDSWRLLGLPQIEFFDQLATTGCTLILVPHPSGRCREYNDPRARARLRRLLKTLTR